MMSEMTPPSNYQTEVYVLHYQDTFLGTLMVDTVTGRHSFEPDFSGVEAVKQETVLIVEILEGTKGFVPPIPFFQNRIWNMKRARLEEIRYHTDYFVLRKVRAESFSSPIQPFDRQKQPGHHPSLQ